MRVRCLRQRRTICPHHHDHAPEMVTHCNVRGRSKVSLVEQALLGLPSMNRKVPDSDHSLFL